MQFINKRLILIIYYGHWEKKITMHIVYDYIMYQRNV